jgi:hypothetical protein
VWTSGLDENRREGCQKGEMPHGRYFADSVGQARLSQECELIIEEIKDHQFSRAAVRGAPFMSAFDWTSWAPRGCCMSAASRLG